MKRAQREVQWLKHIEGWKKGGLTQPRYCERESISYDTCCARSKGKEAVQQDGMRDRPDGWLVK